MFIYMLFIYLLFTNSLNDCYLYSNSCEICVTHFSDRKCGYCRSTKSCIYENETCSTDQFIYGPKAKCSDEKPIPYIPTLTPTPLPSLLPNSCSIYNNDGCSICISHFGDRNCGWCSTTNSCENINTTKCEFSNFYFNGNAKCGSKIPTPLPTPYPRYEADPTFCLKLTNTNCPKCVSTNPNKSCIWCHESKECVMGDSLGPLFGTCQGKFSTKLDAFCFKSSSTWSVYIWITVAILVTFATIIGFILCYKASTTNFIYNSIQ